MKNMKEKHVQIGICVNVWEENFDLHILGRLGIF